jgi:hypothetical protein
LDKALEEVALDLRLGLVVAWSEGLGEGIGTLTEREAGVDAGSVDGAVVAAGTWTDPTTTTEPAKPNAAANTPARMRVISETLRLPKRTVRKHMGISLNAVK